MLILTAHQCNVYNELGGYHAALPMLIKKRWGKQVQISWGTRGTVQAYISHSTWRVDCPFCADGLWAAPNLPFFCVNCLMSPNDGFPMRVEFPENRTDIERILMMRPAPETRNWLNGGHRHWNAPDETIEDLARQNLEHDLPMPDLRG